MPNLLQSISSSLATVGLVIACIVSIASLLELIRRLDRTRKRQAIRTYAKRLSRLLRARYGEQKQYTPAQVKQIMQEWGCSTAYDRYGLAMFCSEADFTDYYRPGGKSYKYEVMRTEISHCLFQTNTPFSTVDVIEASAHFRNHHHGNRAQGEGDDGYPYYETGGYGGGSSYGGCENSGYGGDSGGCD